MDSLSKVEKTVYGDPVVTLMYDKVDISGGAVSPTLSFTQTVTTETATSTITQSTKGVSYTKEYNIISGSSCITSYNSSTGVVIVKVASNSWSIVVVSVTITVNGKSRTATATIEQDRIYQYFTKTIPKEDAKSSDWHRNWGILLILLNMI